MKTVYVVGVLLAFAAGLAGTAQGESPVDIGSRLEPFVDEFLIDTLEGVALQLQKPQPQEIAIRFDKPWEGNTCCYVTVFEDDGLYRMYYRGSHYDLETKESKGGERVCYAESRDGIRWTKPYLGIVDYCGSKQNNLIWDGEGGHNFSPFKDTNPACDPEARYKAVASSHKHKNQLIAYQSPDAIHWRIIEDRPIITEGAFDSQNIAFYDSYRKRYVEFHRHFTDGVRAIMTSSSTDFMHWPKPDWLQYGDIPKEHLYTNAITAFPGAPHLFVGFPKRFVPARDLHVHPYPGVSDAVFMSSRDGLHFKRWREAVIRPGLQEERWVNRNNMTAWGILKTPATVANTPDELSIYSTEGYYVGPCRLRRFTYRQGGFVSLHANAEGGVLTTKPLIFADDPQHVGQAKAQKIEWMQTGGITGNGALHFKQAPAILEVPATKELGNAFTLAAHLRKIPKGYRRLFSAYDGGAVEKTQGELWFSFDAQGCISDYDFAITVAVNGKNLTVPCEAIPDWSLESGDTAPHHLAFTYDQGRMAIYFDGKKVAEGGEEDPTPITLRHAGLLFGEDYPPTLQHNEPFLGEVDNLIVLKQALRPEQMAALAAQGPQALPACAGACYDFEAVSQDAFPNTLSKEAGPGLRAPGAAGPAKTELLLNYSTSAAGWIKCALLDAEGAPLPGYGFAECEEIFGDHLDRAVRWGDSSELAALVGAPIRLQLELHDADLYTIQFR